MTLDGASQELRSRLARLHEEMCAHLIERGEAARLLLLAALSGEHVILLGPPGTAKSELARRLGDCLSDGNFFERLLTKFSVPEELYGPLSIKRLEQDEYYRLTEGYLPTASVAFLDEVFNANSAILNALLTLLNEREFDNGAQRVKTPLVSVVAASNQVPDVPELEALYDRFLFRYQVTPVSDMGFRALLAVPEGANGRGSTQRLHSEEMDAIRKGASDVSISETVTQLLEAIRTALREKNVFVSDRRWRKILKALRVAAYCDGRTRITLADCWLLVHCLWSRPEQASVVETLVGAALDALLVEEPKRYVAMVDAFDEQIETESTRTEPSCDDAGRPLYRDEHARIVTEPYRIRPSKNAAGEPLFAPPSGMEVPPSRRGFTMSELWERHFQNQANGLRALEAWADNPLNVSGSKELREPVVEPTRYSDEHIARRRDQIAQLLGDVDGFMDAIRSLSTEGTPSLWVDGSRGDAIAERLKDAERLLSPLSARLKDLSERIDGLPKRSP